MRHAGPCYFNCEICAECVSVKHVQDSFKELLVTPDYHFDVTITDPPYSAHCQSNLISGSLTQAARKRRPWLNYNAGKGHDNGHYELSFDPLTEYSWLKQLLRVTRRWVVVFCTLEDFGRFEQAVGRPEYVRSCIWYKNNAMGQLTNDRPAAAYEGIAVMHANAGVTKAWNGKGSYGLWKCAGTRGKPGRHPNEKPVALCQKLVALFSQAGETVFDPFCGSGALGEAARSLSRSYVGWDQDDNWVAKARARVTAITPPVFSCINEQREALASCTMNGQTAEDVVDLASGDVAGGILLPGWVCRVCKSFTSVAKEPLRDCRCCGTPR